MRPLRLLDLFSGFGMFSLGLERSGVFRTVAFCEIEPYPRRVLDRHWPHLPIFTDVRNLRAEWLGPVDAICGGFPCQDISFAGKGAGIDGDRSGLWSEYRRLIGELRPRFVIVENVAALLVRGLGRVLGDLAALGYDAWWDCIPASAVGAPHRRDRLWLVAYASRGRCGGSGRGKDQQPRRTEAFGGGEAVADAARHVLAEQEAGRAVGQRIGAGGQSFDPDAFRERLEGLVKGRAAARAADGSRDGCDPGWWLSEPDVGRVAHGVAARVERLRGLGNGLVPTIPYLIGTAIGEAMR